MSQYKVAASPLNDDILDTLAKAGQKMFILSKNQVDYNSGYYGTTEEVFSKIRDRVPGAVICRDHCGPGFNNDDSLEDTKKTIEVDIKNGLDILHIDLSKFTYFPDQKIKQTAKLMEYAISLNPRIRFEIGTEDNEDSKYLSLDEIKHDLESFTKIAPIEYYVIKTGSLVKCNFNVNQINWTYLQEASELVHSYDIQVKEHNGDYLPVTELDRHYKYVDCINIAPQLGYIQSTFIISSLDINTQKKLSEIIYLTKKWKKWDSLSLLKNNKYMAALVTGHYCYNNLLQEYNTDEKKYLFEITVEHLLKEYNNANNP